MSTYLNPNAIQDGSITEEKLGFEVSGGGNGEIRFIKIPSTDDEGAEIPLSEEDLQYNIETFELALQNKVSEFIVGDSNNYYVLDNITVSGVADESMGTIRGIQGSALQNLLLITMYGDTGESSLEFVFPDISTDVEVGLLPKNKRLEYINYFKECTNISQATVNIDSASASTYYGYGVIISVQYDRDSALLYITKSSDGKLFFSIYDDNGDIVKTDVPVGHLFIVPVHDNYSNYNECNKYNYNFIHKNYYEATVFYSDGLPHILISYGNYHYIPIKTYISENNIEFTIYKEDTFKKLIFTPDGGIIEQATA